MQIIYKNCKLCQSVTVLSLLVYLHVIHKFSNSLSYNILAVYNAVFDSCATFTQ